MQRRRHSADRPHLAEVEAKRRKVLARRRRRISPADRRNNRARRTDRRLPQADPSAHRRPRRAWADSVDRQARQLAATVVRRPRNIANKVTRFRLAKVTARWVTRSPSIKCSRATPTELRPVVAAEARSKPRLNLPPSVRRRLKAVSVGRLRRQVVAWVSEAPPQGEGHPSSKRTTPTTRAEALPTSRRSNNRRLKDQARSVIKVNNMAKIKVVSAVRHLPKEGSVDLRRRHKALVDLHQVCSRLAEARSSVEDFPPRGEGPRRRRTVDSRSRPRRNPCRACLRRPESSVARPRSIPIPRTACYARSCSRIKTIRKEISGRCSVVA